MLIKKRGKHLIVILLMSVPTQLPLFPKAKRHSKTIFATTVPSILRAQDWIMHLRASKQNSSGYDDISADVGKRVSDKIFVILKHIFSISLAKAVFPDKLKIARVTSIFKKGNNTLVTNYRPISVLPCFSKFQQNMPVCQSPITESNNRRFQSRKTYPTNFY